MLTVKENLRETLKKDGKPDRFVNQFEFLEFVAPPQMILNRRPARGEADRVNSWGITYTFPESVPGPMPVYGDRTVIKDIEHWKDYVKVPKAKNFSDELWAVAKEKAAKADRNNKFIAPIITPGIFTMCHALMGMEECFMAFYDCPDEMHDLIKCITDWELEMAEDICANLHPDALFHHDDWGSQQSTFMSVPMFEDFYMDSYVQLYKYYKEHGVEVLIHHCDSYAATLVPDMLEMGVDIWQGAMSSNNVHELVEKYKGRLTIMGGIDSAWIDNPEHSAENTRAWVKKICDEYSEPNSFIPCQTQGGPMSAYEGVYEQTCDEIRKYNKNRFGIG